MTINKLRISKKGFTLVELLVVVAIIAILATIGLTVFSGAQANARDARRKSDIDAIAAAIENKRTPGIATYLPITAGDFSSGVIPVDTTAAADAKYCIASTTGGVQPGTGTGGVQEVLTWASTGAKCPTASTASVPAWTTGWAASATAGGFEGTVVSIPANTTYWKLCARLEASTDATTNLKVYCKYSAQ